MKVDNINKWKSIISLFSNERMIAVETVRKLKKNDNSETIEVGRDYYEKVKFEYNDVINHLIIAIVAKEKVPSSLELEEKLNSACKKRDLFYSFVMTDVKPTIQSEIGKKELITLLAAAIGPLCLAIQFIYTNKKQLDTLTRETLKTQLEATIWPDFELVKI